MHIEEDLQTTGLDSGNPGWRFAVGSGILGWVLDAFDFFVVIFLLDTLADHLHVQKKAIVWTISITLAMRPVGALLFGALADRFGRRKPLMACVLYFSAITILSGFAPNFVFFALMRALYGIGMGGYWGIGASFAMENAPRKRRGFLSGMMQGGYPFGYLLAAVAMQSIRPWLGWHALFVVGSLLAVVIVVLTALSPESEAWKLHRIGSVGSIFSTLFHHKRSFAYLLLVMVVMSCLSHGTQDLYPDFLKSMPWLKAKTLLGMEPLFGIPILYNVGAITGALFFGHVSERMGRRKAMIAALVLSLLSIPAWAFGGSLLVLVLGSYLMQTGVQGAFGVIPAHLNELSPDAVRSLFPGFVYQLGVLVASPAVGFEYILRDHLGYPWALTVFESVVIVSLIVIFALGPEARGRSFLLKSAKHSLQT
ncbi:MAG: transporter, family, lactate transporter [Acidobacteriaceae bacterium]|jgi:SHS family lactate transporter-like MFS transporter|nr:transporter, family, lactate transporter [Acidobacteriaceae bacterium]MEA2260642.1 transporter, family, lactate transporter [Acidobacteriaceae bacterium]